MKLGKFNKLLKKEYQDTFNDEKIVIKKSSHFRKILIPIYSLVAVVTLIFVVIGIDTLVTNNHNEYVFRHWSEFDKDLTQSSSKELTPINSSDELCSIIDSYKLTIQDSLLQSIGQPNIGDMAPAGTPQTTPGNMTSGTTTNTQYSNVDETDIAKCDGNYIYYTYNNKLVIYDLLGNNVGEKEFDGSIKSMYVYNNSIVIFYRIEGLAFDYVEIFKLNSTLESVYKHKMNYLDSRLCDNELIICEIIKLVPEKLDYDNLYYDGYTCPSTLYEITNINLDTLDVKKTSYTGNYNANLHMTDDYISIASRVYGYEISGIYTVISVFNRNLEPVGVLKAKGYIYSQFALHEENDLFYVVSTDTTAELSHWNQITVFDLKTLEKIGHLNSGIGLERHTVRSVRYSGSSCFVVTYENKDPLYEIDLSDPKKPYITGEVRGPGYSTYLHQFSIDGMDYLLGVGFTDSQSQYKVSIYKTTLNNSQLGEDFIIDMSEFYEYSINYKAFFFYQDTKYLYFGIGSNSGENKYTILRINVNADLEVEQVCDEYKVIEIESNTRCFYIDGNIYLPQLDKLIIKEL